MLKRKTNKSKCFYIHFEINELLLGDIQNTENRYIASDYSTEVLKINMETSKLEKPFVFHNKMYRKTHIQCENPTLHM